MRRAGREPADGNERYITEPPYGRRAKPRVTTRFPSRMRLNRKERFTGFSCRTTRVLFAPLSLHPLKTVRQPVTAGLECYIKTAATGRYFFSFFSSDNPY